MLAVASAWRFMPHVQREPPGALDGITRAHWYWPRTCFFPWEQLASLSQEPIYIRSIGWKMTSRLAFNPAWPRPWCLSIKRLEYWRVYALCPGVFWYTKEMNRII